MKVRFRWSIPLAILLVFAIVLAGCGGPGATPEADDAQPEQSADEQPADQAESETEPEQESAPQSTLDTSPVTILVTGDPRQLDPHFYGSFLEWTVLGHIFEPLADVNFKTGEIVPRLATSWENVTDTQWRMTLRDDVTFHNGEPFNAETVVYNCERLVDEEVNAQKWFFVVDGNLDHCEVVDEYTVDIFTTKPTAVFLEQLRYWMIVPQEYYSETPLEELALNPVGSGPYTFVEWQKGDHITLDAWEDYYEGPPAFEGIEVRFVPDASTRISELLAGNADIVTKVPPDQAQLIEDSDAAVLRGVDSFQDVFIQFDVSVPPLDDVRVRQAMNYGTNRQAILDTIYEGKGKLLAGVANAFWENTDLEPYPYDPDQARALLAEAGWEDTDGDGIADKDGEPLSLAMTYAPDGEVILGEELAQALASDLGEIGVDVILEPVEISVLNSRIREGTLAPLSIITLGGFGNAVGELRWVAPSGCRSPRCDEIRWQSEEFEQLYEELKGTLDRDERKELVDQAQEIAYEEAPWVFLFKQYNQSAASNRLAGWEERADGLTLLIGVEPQPTN